MDTVQRVYDHLVQIIAIQKEVADLKAQHYLPLRRDYSAMEQRIWHLENGLAEAQTRPAAEGTWEELQVDLVTLRRDAQESEQGVRNLQMQLANALTLAARVAPATPQGQEDTDQKFPHSQDLSGSD